MGTGNAESQSVGLADALRRSWLLILLLSLLGLGAGYAASTRIEEQVSATTKVQVVPLEGNPYYPSTRGEDLVNLNSEAEALRSESVAELVAEETGSDRSATELLRGVRVAVPANTQILEVTFTDDAREDALEYSQAFADAYLDTRRARAQERIDEQAARLDEQIGALSGEIEQLAAELALLPSTSARATVIEQRNSVIAGQLNTLTARRAELGSGVLDPGNVVTPAAVDPAGPLDLQVALPVVGLIFGAAAGVLVAMGRSRTDTRLHSPDSVIDAGVRVIGSIGWTDPTGPTLALDPSIAAEDEYRRLRVAVLAQEKRRPLTILLASTTTEVDAPATAVDLAISLARAGLDTTVVDVTGSRYGPSRVLAPFHPIGLSDVLLGNASLTDTLVPVAPLLWVLPPGSEVGAVADLLMSEEMRRLLVTAKDRADIVLVVADSVQTGGAQSLASMVDAVVVEVEQGRTTRSELTGAARALEVLGSSFVGAVFVGRDAARRLDAFSPDTGISQRQLPSPTPSMLPAAPQPTADVPSPGEDEVGTERSGGDPDARAEGGGGDGGGGAPRAKRRRAGGPDRRTDDRR